MFSHTYHRPAAPASANHEGCETRVAHLAQQLAELHEGCEARVAHLAQQLAELISVNETLRRQRNAAQTALKVLKLAVVS
ncbi:MAG: hypothetical protein JRD94_09615 [Deltaproteobacteria bacterium]|nr:hypothetical protein [Deltaproteobacteria bacterium]